MATATDSILGSIKKLLGLAEDYTEFDRDIIIHINSVFSVLQQLGVGPEDGFSIENYSSTWSDFTNNNSEIKNVVTYMYLNVRLLFDPPTNSTILKSYQDTIKEYEWRLNVAADTGEE